MPLFEYKGVDRQGRNSRGTFDAENMRAAKAKLKKDGIFVSQIKDKKKAKNKKSGSQISGKTVSIQDLSSSTRQLATLLKSNVPLVESLLAISEQTESEGLSEAFSDIKNLVNEGGSLHKGLERYPKMFDKIYISMCEAGEVSGTLDTILLRLAEFTEAQSELNSKVRSAMIYPVVMIVFTLVLLGVITVVVIPKIRDVFDSQDSNAIPWYSKMVFDFSDYMVNNWYIVLGGMGLGYFLFNKWKNSENGSKKWDAILLKMPLIGKLVRLIAVSRFTRTLSTLLVGGVPMLDALAIVKNVVNNYVLGTAIEEAAVQIREGESVAGPLKKSGQFPPLVIHMIRVGEKTGELENMLNQVSDSYDFEVKTKVDGITSLMEPVLLIVMGLVIGVIVFAIMIPVLNMSSAIG